MTPLSGRHARGLLLVAALAAVPVAVHSTGRLDRDSCADPAVMATTLLIPGSKPVAADDKPPGPGDLQLSKGTVPLGPRNTPPLHYALVRTLDPTRVTTRPAGFVAPRLEAQSQALAWVERDGERLPIHWLEEETRAGSTLVAYVFAYEGRAVESPLASVLGSALERLVRGPRPVTLLAVAGVAPPRQVEAVRARMQTWIFDAWEHYRRSCRPGPPAAD